MHSPPPQLRKRCSRSSHPHFIQRSICHLVKMAKIAFVGAHASGIPRTAALCQPSCSFRSLLVSLAFARLAILSCMSVAMHKCRMTIHTCAWMWERAPNLHGSRLLDIELDGVQLHPHMVHKKSLKWLQHIFQRYHHGHKTTLTGKPTFVAPVGGPWQVLWRCGCHLPACFRCSHSVLSGTTLS